VGPAPVYQPARPRRRYWSISVKSVPSIVAVRLGDVAGVSVPRDATPLSDRLADEKISAQFGPSRTRCDDSWRVNTSA
jgi:hypothetical protein